MVAAVVVEDHRLCGEHNHGIQARAQRPETQHQTDDDRELLTIVGMFQTLKRHYLQHEERLSQRRFELK